MTVAVTVLYPRTENWKFDQDYYKNVHLPLVAEKFGKHGLKEWRISKLVHPDPSQEAQWIIQADLIFPSAEDARTAFEKEGKEVLGDIPNFTNTEATIMIGEIYGTGHGKN